MSFRHDYRPDAVDMAWMMLFDRKEEEELEERRQQQALRQEREREQARERQRQQELERERQREQERLRLLEQERERLRQQELEQERQREQERLRLLEQERERLREQELERERQREQERLRLIEQERERLRQQELERERLREQERLRLQEQERERQQELEREREREKERLRLLEQERERQRQIQLQQERERQQELERERQREQERIRLQEQERERQRDLERERQREQERLRLLELERERQHQVQLQQERKRQQELVRERQREQQRLRLIEQERERQRQVQLQQERERQQELEREREREQERQMQMMEEQREQLRAKQEVQMTEIQRSVQVTTEEIKRVKLNEQDRVEPQEEECDMDCVAADVAESILELERLRLGEEEEEESEKKKYPVVVVGCGASGIAALAKLTEAGIPAVGVEASKRMGGRINTVNFGAGVVDLGAAWCHGEGENIVFRLANPHGLLGKPDTGNDQDWYVFSDGSLMPPGNAKAILQSINNKVNANKDGRGSIREFVRTGVREKSIIPKPKLIPINEPFLRWYEQDYHLGGREDPLAAKSLKALSKQKNCEGEFWLHWKGKGFKSLLDLLLHKLPGTGTPINPNIQYNKEVVNICYPIPAPEPEDPEQTVLVKFKDGTAMKASKVIVTVPLGVLKQNYATMFTPGLPLRKIEAINNLQVFVLDKIIMEFEKAWWPEGMVNLRILWRDEDKALFKDEKWVTGIHGFRIVEHRPKVLLAWITGPLAEEMERVRDDQLSKGIHKLIKHVFSLNFDVPMITNLTRSKWAAEEFAKGSFSYRGVSTERCASASAEVLAEPLDVGGTPVVFFAGEATSQDWHGHVHGAVQAGFREADNVIKSMPK